jgi:hypothetical protein
MFKQFKTPCLYWRFVERLELRGATVMEMIRRAGLVATLLCGLLVSTQSLAEGRAGSALVSRQAASSVPESATLGAYRQSVSRALNQSPAVLGLSGELDARQREAQSIALADARFLEGIRDKASNAALRNEIMGVYALRDSDIVTPEVQVCKTAATRCLRVEMFLFAANDTRVAVIDWVTKKALSVRTLIGIQPEISPRLERIALELAATSPVTAAALGRAPSLDEFIMATSKASLAKTRCERSQHLCVAPTIVEGQTALFVVVDLTALKVVGARWSKLGRAASVPSEKRVQNETISREFCERATSIDRNGWKFNFQITSSDGVRVADVEYQGAKLYKSIKTVDWHVSYPWKEKLGYSDAVGCPVFSQAAVVAIDPPVFEALKENGVEVGFSLVQDFRSEQWPRPCNYFYRQRFDFFNDGRLRPWSASYGRGCGDGATYRPVTRIEFTNMTSVASMAGNAWSEWKSEDWRRSSDLSAATDGAKLRFSSSTGVTVNVRPNDGAPGAKNDGRTCASCHDKPVQPRADSARSLGLAQTRGDDAYLYVTVHPTGRDEGASDMPPIGTCCNDDHKQGPHRFMEPKEPIDAKSTAPLVFWYVAQMVNDARQGHEYCWADFVIDKGVYVPRAYPCYSGPTLSYVQPPRNP